MAAALLQVREIEVLVATEHGELLVVDRVSLEIGAGEAVGVVGESGCGKTMLALSILGLLPRPTVRISHGSILFEGEDLLELCEGGLRKVRGNRIGMVFQEPATSLNPVLTVGEQISEVLRAHAGLDRLQARRGAIEALRAAGIAAPETRVDAYPHQLSGGMRQRASLAIALAGAPALLIADEPTTALDATVEAQILDLLGRQRKERGLAVLLVSHDLAVVCEVCERVVVLHAGQVVEQGPARAVFTRPSHPYTEALLRCLPPGVPSRVDGRRARLEVIPGGAAEPSPLSVGCRFAGRCARVEARCRSESPGLVDVGEGRMVRCFLPSVVSSPIEAKA